MRSWFPRAWTRNDIPFSQQIQNVEFATVVSKRSESKQSEAFYAAHGMDRFGKNTSILKADAVAISFFTGTEVLRKTCNIRFIRSWAPKMILIVQSPFFDVIKDLVGFATVVLHVLPHKVDWRAEEALFYIGHDASYTNYAVGFRVIVDAMSRALEPTLGPSVISLKNGDDCAEDKWKITFHPQDFNSRKKDSDADSESSVNEAVPPLNNS